MTRILLAAALATTAALAIPTTARPAEDQPTQQAQAATPTEEQMGEDRGGGRGRWMRGEGGFGMRGGPGMMMRRTMMRGNPEERCERRLAWRAAMRAYVGAMLNLTPEQRPLWDKVQSIAQTTEQKEHQLCSSLKPGGEASLLDRLDRMQAFLSARLEGLQTTKPAVQALYQALTPEQRAIIDHPFRR
jgi:LTXXQ motif family protein